MQKMLGVALAAGLAFLPLSAHAADTAQGIVQSVDVVTGVFVIKAEGPGAHDMSFTVSEKLDFDELSLEAGERLAVEYDSKQCADKTACVSTATKVSRPKS